MVGSRNRQPPKYDTHHVLGSQPGRRKQTGRNCFTCAGFPDPGPVGLSQKSMGEDLSHSGRKGGLGPAINDGKPQDVASAEVILEKVAPRGGGDKDLSMERWSLTKMNDHWLI